MDSKVPIIFFSIPKATSQAWPPFYQIVAFCPGVEGEGGWKPTVLIEMEELEQLRLEKRRLGSP